MKANERDELLIRLDERTANIYHLTEKQEKHLSDLNDAVAKNTIGMAVAKSGIKRIYWVAGGLALVIIGLWSSLPLIL